MTVTGMLFGKVLAKLFGRKVEIFGGLVLIAIGVKILIDHLV
jgi:putative Mn2+ efflux pump MntP